VLRSYVPAVHDGLRVVCTLSSWVFGPRWSTAAGVGNWCSTPEGVLRTAWLCTAGLAE